jgi:16S rRNA (adenine(1408)-N(1))-methyltransferase
VLATAAAEPDRLVIGVDANAAAMVEAARRAAAKPNRGGVPNALFVVAAVEAIPEELGGVADLVTVHFPWGSLLRGLLAADRAIMAGVTRLMRPGAVLLLLVSAEARDGGVGVEPIRDDTLHRVADAYRNHGLTVNKARTATADDVTATHSTWGKRLGVGVQRQAWLLQATMHAHHAPDELAPAA